MISMDTSIIITPISGMIDSWRSVTMSDDGKIIVAGTDSGNLYVSTNYGLSQSWSTPYNYGAQWFGLSMTLNSNSAYVYAGDYTTKLGIYNYLSISSPDPSEWKPTAGGISYNGNVDIDGSLTAINVTATNLLFPAYLNSTSITGILVGYQQVYIGSSEGSNTSTVTVYFNTDQTDAFEQIPYVFITLLINNISTSGYNLPAPIIKSITLNSFTFSQYNGNSSTSSNLFCNWMAVGTNVENPFES
jgi:hypothetical protein